MSKVYKTVEVKVGNITLGTLQVYGFSHNVAYIGSSADFRTFIKLYVKDDPKHIERIKKRVSSLLLLTKRKNKSNFTDEEIKQANVEKIQIEYNFYKTKQIIKEITEENTSVMTNGTINI